MVRKKNRHIVLIVIGIVVLLLALNWFGVFDNIKTGSLFSTVPIIVFPTETLSPYTCDKQYCQVQGKLECSNGGEAPKVVFRTNVLNGNYNSQAFDGKMPWIAYSVNDVLTSFIYSTTEVLNVNNFGTTPDESLRDGADLYFNGGNLYITKHETVPDAFQVPTGMRLCSGGGGNCNTRTTVCSVCDSDCIAWQYSQKDDCGPEMKSVAGEKFYKFSVGTGADTTTTTKEPFTSQNCNGVRPCQEIVLGSQNVYNCNGFFNVYKPDGNLISSESLSQPGDAKWNKSSTQQTITNGYVAKMENIGNGGIGHLFYGTSEDRPSCGIGNKPVCSQSGDLNGDHTGFYDCKCINGECYLDRSYFNMCDLDNGFVCVDSIGNCTFPLTYDVKFVDSNGLSKTGFGPSENIFINTKIKTLSSSQLRSGTVNLLIYQYGQSTPISNYNLAGYDFTRDTTISTPINNPGNAYLGQQFYVVLAITYNQKTIYVGRENKDYSFRIAPSLSCNVGFMSNINGQTRTTLYKGYPIDLNIYTSESGLATSVEHINMTLSLNTGSTVIPIVLTDANLKSSGVTSSSTYSYVYEFTVSSSGTLDPIISIEKSSISQDCNAQSTRVNELTVSPSFTNIAKYTYKCVQQNSPIDLTVEIKDSLGNFIDPQNLALKVIFSNTTLQQDITASLEHQKDSSGNDIVGKYHFSYNFPQVGSTYFQIGSNFFNGINTGALDVLSNCQLPDCVQNSDCTGGKVCINNTCQDNGTFPNWWIYIIIGIGALVGIIVLVVVIRILNKPKQEVYTGLGGL